MNKKITHATALLDPKQYFENNFQGIYVHGTPFSKTDEEERNRRLKEFVGGEIDDEKFRNLAAYCSAELLRESEEPLETKVTDDENKLRMKYFRRELTQDTGLQTLLAVENRIKLDPRERFSLTLKHRSERSTDQRKTFKPVGPPDLEPGKDVLYRIRVYRPFVATNFQRNRNPLFAHDVVVYGSQTLDVLRDSIQCCNENTIRVEMSNQPDAKISFTGKDMFKSGFVFIEDTFYNDFRSPDNIDYSECIREWALKRKNKTFRTANIMDVTFDDLKFRLGHPQVYQHQGNCEHLLVFSDVRLLQPTDVCHSSFYPHRSILAPSHTTYCMACRQYPAKWTVIESDSVMFDPFYYCNVCFKSYNYLDGKKIGNFRAYQCSANVNEENLILND